MTRRTIGPVVPLGFLLVALVVAAALSATRPDIFPPSVLPWAVAGTLAAAALRVGAHRWPEGSAEARAGLWAGILLTGALVWCSPAFGLYAFLFYPEIGRHLRGAAAVPGLLTVAAVCSLSQTGGPRSPLFTPGVWLLFLLVNLAIAAAMHGLDRRRERTVELLRAANEDLRRAEARNEELRGRLVEQARTAGISEERERLAREIHDTIAQDLVAVISLISVVPESARDPGLTARLGRAEEVARAALAEARRAVQALSSPRLDVDDLPAAIQRLLASWRESFGIPAELAVNGAARPTAADGTVLRVVQEALSNTARHAGATGARIELDYRSGGLRVRIRDDGRGFDTRTPPPGHGITGMIERAEAAGGTLAVHGGPGRGTIIEASFPEGEA